ncbi:MAG: aminopeptidase P family protein [Eubacteriales bacterium]|nr:aminopeptidase P family protein [Eubacteriales bacterium]
MNCVNERINKLRQLMKEHGMDAYIIPTEDYHNSEYVGEYFKAREYMSGFTGSAGTLVVLADRAALWTDGRYFLQAESQLETSEIVLMRAGQPDVPKIAEYLKEQLPAHGVVGFDGRTVSNRFVREVMEIAGDKAFSFAGDEDLVDLVWEKRPSISKEPVWKVEDEWVGMNRSQKLAMVREKMQKKKTDVLLVTALDDIAWLLNLRGADVAYTPVFLAYMMIRLESATLCVHEEILSEKIVNELKENGIDIMPYDAVDALVKEIAEEQVVWVEEGQVNYHLTNCIPASVKKYNAINPIVGMKAKKTVQEMEHICEAHIKDGVAVTKFIYWLKQQVKTSKVTECSAATKLLEFRKQMDGFLDQSFDPIIAYGAHGAIIHYSATEQTDAVMEAKGLCLADTGGHYKEGTTDITRTIALGPVTEEEKRAFTLVLKGNLNLGAAVFMEGCCGQNLDYLARKPLWEHQLDFNHGTGHGVGYILNVHEGPQRIHWRITKDTHAVPLEEGMLISNEPGLYIPGQFGIRHENLVLCRKGEKNDYGQFMYFETVTMVPFDREAIDCDLMTKEELELLNAYHKKVYEKLVPYMNKEEAAWLKEATSPLSLSK